jgi:hypothetical protein
MLQWKNPRLVMAVVALVSLTAWLGAVRNPRWGW